MRELAVNLDYLRISVKNLLLSGTMRLPWFLLPRHWRSSLFRYHSGESTKITCALLIAKAFMSIRYPILPLVHEQENGNYELIRRNTKLFTPHDFDYSPYFSVIKCQVVEFSGSIPYTTIPWNKEWISHDGEGISKANNKTKRSKKMREYH